MIFSDHRSLEKIGGPLAYARQVIASIRQYFWRRNVKKLIRELREDRKRVDISRRSGP